MNVLFVCKGNICRSPTAHYVLQAMIQKAGKDHKVDSCGTDTNKEGERGKPMWPRSERALFAKYGEVGQSGHKAKQMNNRLLMWADAIVPMDKENVLQVYRALTVLGVKKRPKVWMLPGGEGRVMEIEDPYWSEDDGVYRQVLKKIEIGCANLFPLLR